MSRVQELNDNCFALATEMVALLSKEFEQEIGGKPSIEELCELLADGIRGCAADILSDVNPQSVLAIKPVVMQHKKVRLTPGDIVAVPAAKGGFHFVVFITQNRFGWAFGLLRGRQRLPRLPQKWEPIRVRYPIYSGMKALVSGRWRIVANRPDALRLFPADPEIFYPADMRPEDVPPSRYGWALAPAGGCRVLKKSEADEIGLLHAYDAIFLEKQFEEYLDRHSSQ